MDGRLWSAASSRRGRGSVDCGGGRSVKKGVGEGDVTVSGEGGVEDRRRPEKRVEGIEPSSIAWKAIALPLSYTRGAVVRAPADAS